MYASEILASHDAAEAAAKRVLDQQEMFADLRPDRVQGGFVQARLTGTLTEHYTNCGRRVARLAEVVCNELPVLIGRPGELNPCFLAGRSDEERGQAAAMASLIGQAKQADTRTSRLPWRRGARLRLEAYPTYYRPMYKILRARRTDLPELIRAYQQGYEKEADELGLPYATCREATALFRHAPRRFHGLLFPGVVRRQPERKAPEACANADYFPWTPTNRQEQERPQPAEPATADNALGGYEHLLVTQEGVVLALTRSAYTKRLRPPVSAAALDEQLRVQLGMAPTPAQLQLVATHIWGVLMSKADAKTELLNTF